MAAPSLEVAVDDVDQRVGGLVIEGVGISRAVDEAGADMVLDHLREQPASPSSARLIASTCPPIGSQRRALKPPEPRQSNRIIEGERAWCGREDSNFQGVSPASTSS